MNINYYKETLLKMMPSLNSEKLRIDWCTNELRKIPNKQSIIDLGAGEMLFKQYCAHLSYVSQDIGKYKGKGDGEGLHTGTWNASKVDIISDIIRLPVKDSSFDNALCTAVLEHVPYPARTIKEIGRILKKKGKLILDAPFCSQTHFSPFFFTTGFSFNWYKLILPKYGFKIIKLIPYGNYFNYLSVELLRLPLVMMKYSKIGIVSFLIYLFIAPLIIILGTISKCSKGSEKQLCFGYHVLAVKI